MRTINTVEENGYFMTFVTDDKTTSIGESHSRDESILQALELADLQLG